VKVKSKNKIDIDQWDYVALGGCLSIFVGLWWMWPPLALIDAGGLAIFLSFVASKPCRS
jgi:hypothetical protein